MHHNHAHGKRTFKQKVGMVTRERDSCSNNAIKVGKFPRVYYKSLLNSYIRAEHKGAISLSTMIYLVQFSHHDITFYLEGHENKLKT